MPKQSFAINCSDASLEAVELDRQKDSLVVVSQSRVVLPSGVIENGKIVDPEKMKTALRTLLHQAQPRPFSGKEVILTIPESKVFIQTYELPANLHDRQVPSALFSQARETLPVDPSLIVADYREIGRAGEAIRYCFAATYRDLMKEYIALFQNIGLHVSVVTMESLALAAAILDESKDETVLVLDIGSRTTIASIFKKGLLHESININIAGNAITSALSEKLKISFAEAEQRKISGSGLRSVAGDGSEMLIIQGQLQPLKDELLLFVKFYEQNMQGKIDRIVLSGGTAALPGIEEYFSANLGLPASVASPLPVFQFAADRATAAQLLVAIGLARIAFGDRSMTVNFLEKSEKDWLPDKHSFKSVVAAASPAEATAHPNRTKAIVYTLLLIIAAMAFGAVYSWKKFGSVIPAMNFVKAPQITNGLSFIIRPFSGAPTEPKMTSFSFGVALKPEASKGGDLGGVLKEIQIVETVFDPELVSKTQLRLSRSLGREPAADELAAGVREDIGTALWRTKYDYYASEQTQKGALLLPDYLDWTIAESDTSIAISDGVVAPGSRFNATYRSLVVNDAKALESLEKKTMDSFLKFYPGYLIEQKKFRYDASQPDRIEVFAEYYFTKR